MIDCFLTKTLFFENLQMGGDAVAKIVKDFGMEEEDAQKLMRCCFD